MSHYDSGTDGGLIDTIGDWIDEKVHGGLKAGGRGALAVLGSGFGKGLIATALIATAAIVAATLFMPEALALLSIPATEATLGAGLTSAGNFLLGSSAGLLALAAGGTAGSLMEAHGENARLNDKQAQTQAELYQHLREASVNTPQHAQEHQMECSGGHCAKLLSHKKEQGRGR